MPCSISVTILTTQTLLLTENKVFCLKNEVTLCYTVTEGQAIEGPSNPNIPLHWIAFKELYIHCTARQCQWQC